MIMKSKLIQGGFIASMLLPAIVGYSVVGVNALETNQDAKCQIETVQDGNVLYVQAKYLSDHGGIGSYQFGVSNGGGVNINQGGSFQTLGDEPQVLSQVVLSRGAKAYDANLHIIFENQVAECQTTFR